MAATNYQTMANFLAPVDDDLDAMLAFLPSDTGRSLLRESSTDASTPNPRGLFTSAASLDPAQSSVKQLTNQTTAGRSQHAFDWNNWEDWVQWDRDNALDTSRSVSTAAQSMPYLDQPPILDDRKILVNQDMIDISSAPGLTATSADTMGQYNSGDWSFERWPNEQFEFGLSRGATKLPAEELLGPNLPLLEQFQFGSVSNARSGIPVEHPAFQGLDFQSSNSSEQSLSPEGSNQQSTSVSSPDSSLSPQSKKRKSLEDDEDAESRPTGPKRLLDKKSAHKMVEKKYRMNLNEKIAALRDSIPSLQSKDSHHGSLDDGDENICGESKQTGKPNKGEVLMKATEYIRHLEKRNRKLNDEVANLKRRLNAFKALAMTQSIGLGSGMVQGSDVMLRMYGDEARQIHRAGAQEDGQAGTGTQLNNQPHGLSHRAWPLSTQSGGSYVNKLMLGSMIGFMIIQGFSGEEGAEDTSSNRGLFALPTQYLGSMRNVLQFLHQPNVMGYKSLLDRPFFLLKAALLIALVAYLIIPLFLNVKPREEPKTSPGFALAAAPSLALPVEVRQSAWLTAVQTVWVPRQSLLLQIVALFLKSLKLFLRNVIGWRGYALLTGTTEEQEAARIKAWEIALDAQLAGGDAEINVGRLVLTMIASGTLPETPYRLMVKALHIHVLLWGAAHGKVGGLHLYRRLAAGFARYYWERARKLQKQASSLSASNAAPRCDELPDYLTRLLELDSDIVLVDAVVQRAYNLAWNKPTADVADRVDGMNGVVDDPAIRSPLDAVAAWYSNMVLHDVLTKSLEVRTDRANLESASQNDLEIALKIAPTASLVQSRCLVVRALLLPEGRGASISAVLKALPILSSPSITPAPTNTESASPSFTISPISTDLLLALRCAMAIAFLRRPKYSKAAIKFSKRIQSPHNTLTLIEFSAMYNFLEAAFQDKVVANEIRDVLENTAGSLKIWIGGEQGKNSGLRKETKVNVSALCIRVLGWLVGRNEYLEDQDGGAMGDG